MTDLPLDKVLVFLGKVEPFSELPAPLLGEVAKTLLIDYFPEGELILSPGATDQPFLYLVFSGVARCFVQEGELSVTLRHVSERDHFGSEGVLTGRYEYSVQVLEDTICYLVKKRVFDRVAELSVPFGRYFMELNDSLTVQIAGRLQREEQNALDQLRAQRGSSSQFRTPIRSLIGRAPVCCSPKTTVSEIARSMAFTGVGSVIVLEGEEPVGIVTKNDLTGKILARGRSGEVPAYEIMSENLLTMNPDGSCFEASLRMVQNHCHHMVAMTGEKLFGVISQHDLILLQGANPAAVVGGIDKQNTVAGLKKCVRDMSVVQQALLTEGGAMVDIWALMTTFRDTLTRRLTVLGIEELRKQGKEPPVLEFSGMTFGTPGRRETLLRESFLEGLIYKDPEPSLKGASEAYFEGLGTLVRNGLMACGLLHRDHGQFLCLTESMWQQRFMALSEGKEALPPASLRILDFRGISEDQSISDRLGKYVYRILEQSRGVFPRMRNVISPAAIPICFYRDEVVGSAGRRDKLSLKNDVLTPLVDSARVLALEKGIKATSTMDRIEGLSEIGAIDPQEAKDLQSVFQWLVRMTLQRALDEERSVDWIIDPRHSSSEEKRLLTESFRLIRRFVERAA